MVQQRDIPPQASTPPISTSKRVGQLRGERLPHGCTSCTGIGHAEALGCHGPHLRIRAAGSGGGPTLPFTKRTLGEGSDNLTTPPPFCMRDGRRFGPSSHLGGGGPHKGAHRGACHPQPDLVEGYPLLLVSLWGEGVLKRLPPTLGVRQERVSLEPLPGPSLCWRGVHALDEPPGHG